LTNLGKRQKSEVLINQEGCLGRVFIRARQKLIEPNNYYKLFNIDNLAWLEWLEAVAELDAYREMPPL